MKQLGRWVLSPFVLILLLSSALRADLSSDIHASISDKALSKAEIGIHIVRLGASAGQSQVLFDQKGSIPRPRGPAA